MKKGKLFKFTGLVVFLVIFSLVALVGYNQSYTYKYYETFRYVTNANQSKELILIDELTTQEIDGKWYLKVYFDGDNQVVKLENYDKDGNLYESVTDTQLLNVKEK